MLEEQLKLLVVVLLKPIPIENRRLATKYEQIFYFQG